MFVTLIFYTNPSKSPFFKGRLDRSIFNLRNNTLRKTARHFSWLAPLSTSIGGLVYGCIKENGAANAFDAAKHKLSIFLCGTPANGAPCRSFFSFDNSERCHDPYGWYVCMPVPAPYLNAMN